MLTYGIPPEFRGGVQRNHHTPSGQSQVYRVTQLRTDGVHCRESAGTGPVNLKVVPNGCRLGRSVKKSKRGACEQKAATVLSNRTAATQCIRSSLSFFEFDIVRYGGTS